jgi:hypothetical protein
MTWLAFVTPLTPDVVLQAAEINSHLRQPLARGEVDDPSIWLCPGHFAATASLAGAVLFHDLIDKATVQMAEGDGHACIAFCRLVTIVWISFAGVLVTDAGCFVVQVAQMADVPLLAVFTDGGAGRSRRAVRRRLSPRNRASG